MKINFLKKTVKLPFCTLLALLAYNIEYAQSNIEVPFAVVEKPPIYPGCEKYTEAAEQKKYFSKNVSHFVNSRFHPKTNSIGRQRISVIFKIDKSGKVSQIRARASNKDLEEQAIAVIKKLPLMKPGYQRGRAVTIPYSVPIIFGSQSINNTRESAASFEIEHKTKSRKQVRENNNSKEQLKKSKDTTHQNLRKLFKLDKK